MFNKAMCIAECKGRRGADPRRIRLVINEAIKKEYSRKEYEYVVVSISVEMGGD